MSLIVKSSPTADLHTSVYLAFAPARNPMSLTARTFQHKHVGRVIDRLLFMIQVPSPGNDPGSNRKHTVCVCVSVIEAGDDPSLTCFSHDGHLLFCDLEAA